MKHSGMVAAKWFTTKDLQKLGIEYPGDKKTVGYADGGFGANIIEHQYSDERAVVARKLAHSILNEEWKREVAAADKRGSVPPHSPRPCPDCDA